MPNSNSARGTTAPADLIDASHELHWAGQFLASIGQTFAEVQADDSHRAMEWDSSRRAFVSAPFAGAYPFRVGLRPEDLTLMLLDRTDEALGSFPLAGTTIEEGYEWLSLGLATYMGGAPPVIERPEYDMPAHRLQSGARFSTGQDVKLRILARLFADAATLLDELVSGRGEASPIRCWPHHFDLATLLEIEKDEAGVNTKTVGVGLAPFGGGYESWYWYVTPWPYPDAAALPSLVSGAWRTEGWVGAVLTGQEVAHLDEGQRMDAVRSFLAESITAAISVITDRS